MESTKAANSTRLAVALVSAVGFLLALPCFLYGLPGGQDAPYHVSNQIAFTKQFWSGDWYPRWLSEMNAGAGSPIMYIMYPLPYLAGAFLSPMLPEPANNPKAAVELGAIAGLALLASGLTAWVWLRRLVRPWPAALASCAYMVLPYHVTVDLYSRAAVGEHLAFVWLPLLMLFGGAMVGGGRRSFVGFACVFALVLMSHLFTALLFLPIVAAYCVFISHQPIFKSAIRLAAAVLLGFALAGIYVVPLAVHQGFFDHGILALHDINHDYRNHFAFLNDSFIAYASGLAGRLRVPPALLLLIPVALGAACIAIAGAMGVVARLWQPRHAALGLVAGLGVLVALCLPVAEPIWRATGLMREIEFDQNVFAGKMFFVTVSTFLVAATAAVGAFTGAHRRLSALFALTAVASFFMSLPWSQLIWDAIPPMANLEFPWRFNALTTFAATVLIGLSFEWLLQVRSSPRVVVAVLLGGLTLLVSIGNAALLNIQTRVFQRHHFSREPGIGSLLTTYAKSSPADWIRDNRASVQRAQFLEVSPPAAAIGARTVSPRRIELDIYASEPAAVKVRQLFYPAWKAFSGPERKSLTLRPSTPEGYLSLDVRPGSHQITLLLARTTSEWIGWYTSMFGVFIVGVLAAGPRLQHVRRMRSTVRRAAVWFDRLAAKKRTCVVLCGALIVALRLAILPWLGTPEPRALDGFSQLLAAKTFASGNWTMPTHPMWIHFEAPYIIHQPTYASKYAPGPPFMMALGILIGGHPWVGILISAALMCGAFCWMLQGWLPPRWALMGALLGVARYSLHHYWLNSYFGGTLAAFGGALVLGALPRILRKSSTPAALAMGAGFAIMISARPYEGLLFFLVPGLLVAAWTIGSGAGALRRRLATIILPAALPVVAAAVPYAYYNFKVTGHALKLPYTVHTQRYEPVPHFIWQQIRPQPRYNHAVLARFFHWPEQLLHQRTLKGMGERLLATLGLDVHATPLMHPKVLTNILFGVLLIPSIFLVSSNRRMRVPLIVFAVMVTGLLLETWYFDHYAAPMAGLVLLLISQGLRHVAVLRPWRRRMWRTVPIAIVATAFAVVLFYSLIAVRILVEPPGYVRVDLPRTAAHIGRHPGKHLALVRYHHGFSLHSAEFVYNEPDIDAARVVWAHDMGPRLNRKLLQYFQDRQVWGICKGDWPARIYRGQACPEGGEGTSPAEVLR